MGNRSFYYSPSASPKNTWDALPLLLSFELTKETRQEQAVFVPVHWRLTTLHDLRVDLKFEFNQSNWGLYGNRAAFLSEAEVK